MKPYIYTDPQLDFDDILLVPSVSAEGLELNSRSDVKLSHDIYTPYSRQRLSGIPIIAANMDGVGTFEVAEVLGNFGCFTALHKHYTQKELYDFYTKHGSPTNEKEHTLINNVFYSIGANKSDYENFKYLKLELSRVGVTIPNICFDVANLYSTTFHKFLAKIRKENPSVVIMAGNVVTPDVIDILADIGVDIVKLGIGPSSVCTTRTQTGVGYPQLSCVMNAAKHTRSILICSDGGCNHPGDFSKAFAAGADFVMTGSMLAGTDEGGGIVKNGMVEFYGMSSKTANNKHFGGLRDYRSSEGRTVQIPYKGSMEHVIKDILGGIRSTCTYIGVDSLPLLRHNARYIRVNKTINNSFEKYTVGN